MTNETIQKTIRMDHDKIRKLVKELEKALENKSTDREGIFNNLASELLAHSKAEEKILYDTLKEEGNEDLNKTLAEGKEEHHLIEVLIKEMRFLSPDDKQWDAKFEVLRENLEHHLKEEERDILPDSKKLIGNKEESKELAEEFLDEKQEEKFKQSF